VDWLAIGANRRSSVELSPAAALLDAMVMRSPDAERSSSRIASLRRVCRRVFAGRFARTSVLAFLAGSVGIACPAAKSNVVVSAAPSISHTKEA
jgi:hypothetical protein